MLNNAKEHRFITGLDGLRAFAIIFIVAYHFSFNWASGGFLGVDIFFVLSGYLITSKLLQQQEKELSFNLIKFWCSRAKRLLPAAYAMIVTTVLWVVLFNQNLLSKLWEDALASIFYLTNWWFIFHKLSYFDSFGVPSPLKHLWFLAVQEQFFFVWSIILTAGFKYYKKREKLSIIVFILSLCSSLLMSLLYSPDADPSRIYFGTDTRSFELLTGSLLAIVFPIEKLSNKKTTVMISTALNITSVITLSVFFISAIFVNEYNAFLYRGGLFIFSLNTAVLIACICHPSVFLGDMLSWKPLRWIGTRSYEIYLWHYPIMVLSTPVYEIGNPVYWRVILQLAVTCILSELSYSFIETPIRRLGFRSFYRKHLSLNIFKNEILTLTKKFPSAMTEIAIVILIVSITTKVTNRMDTKNTEFIPAAAVVNTTSEAASYTDSEKSCPENYSTVTDKINMTNSVKTTSGSFNIKSETAATCQNKSYNKILALGDSIMLDISQNLKNQYTNITVDGKVSRQLVDAVKLATSYADYNNADDAVILELGTNGYFTDNEIDSLLNSFSKAHIYLVNTRVPRSWEKKVNQILKQKSLERSNVILVDWYSAAIKHPEYFESDGVHLKPSGSEALTNLIGEALNSK